MDVDISESALVGILIAEGDMVEIHISPETHRLLRLLGHTFRPGYLGNTLRRYLSVRIHNHGERRHHHTVHHQSNILNDGKNISGTGAAIGSHPAASHPKDQYSGGVEHQQRKRLHRSHTHIGPDNVFRHYPGGLGNALLLMGFSVERPDYPDPPQPLPHDIVLPVCIVVGLFPERRYFPSDDHHRHENQRHKAQQNQGQHHVLAESQQHTAYKQHRNGDNRGGKEGGHPGDSIHIVGGTSHQSGSSHGAKLLKGQTIDLAENVPADIGTEGRHYGGADLRPHQNRSQATGSHQKHLSAAAEDIGEVRIVHAIIDNIAHDGGQEQIAKGGQSNHYCRQGHLTLIGQKIT